jgi:hypothetical protein
VILTDVINIEGRGNYNGWRLQLFDSFNFVDLDEVVDDAENG